MGYQPDKNRYQTMQYRRCGQSGLRLPVISLGLWHNFGDATRLENSRQLLQHAFDLVLRISTLPITMVLHRGRPSVILGVFLQEDFLPWRDELIISTKAGYTMWEGPYGD